MSGILVTITPDGRETVQTIAKKPTLEQYQKEVDGYIEGVRVRYNGRIRDAYVNEEGLIIGLPFNHTATALMACAYAGRFNPLFGNLVVWVPDPKAKKAKV